MSLVNAKLDDKYTAEAGQVYLTGIQALVRLPLLQQACDRAAGFNTAGFISGYRGSPLSGLDLAQWQAEKHLRGKNIIFQPGINEDLAATAVWGSQQVNLFQGAKYEGIFGMWYGKGPGVDRKLERQLIKDYESLVELFLANLNVDNFDNAVAVAQSAERYAVSVRSSRLRRITCAHGSRS